MNIQSFKVTVVPFYYHCSENLYVPAILGHLKDVTLHQYSNVRIRFSSDLDSILEQFCSAAVALWRTLLHMLYLWNTSAVLSQPCLVNTQVHALSDAWLGCLATINLFASFIDFCLFKCCLMRFKKSIYLSQIVQKLNPLS